MKQLQVRFGRERAAFLAALGRDGARADRERAVSQMLRSLLFVSFLQKKGLLGTQEHGACNGERDYLLRRLEMVQQKYGRGHFQAFYCALLLKLFAREEASQERPREFDELLGTVPYLHDDLCALSELVERERALLVPDEAFERLLRFLETFEWCLDDRPLRKRKEINLEGIGLLFEEFRNQKQKGIYYTQDDVTAYIGKNSIIPRLFELVARRYPMLFRPGEAIWELLRADLERYMYPALKHGCALSLPSEIEAGIKEVERREAWDGFAGVEYALPLETWREVVARRQRYEQVKARLAGGAISSIDELITENLDICLFAQDVLLSTRRIELLAAFYAALQGLAVLDPTCGAGAFLLAALVVLEPLYAACLERAQQLRQKRAGQREVLEDEEERQAWRDFDELLSQADAANRQVLLASTIIEHNLYGVDSMGEATEICKLRLFLKLVARVETKADIKSLSAVRFNIRVGNALVGFATPRELVRAGEREPGSQLFARVMRQEQALARLSAELQRLRQAPGQAKQLATARRQQRALSQAWSVSLDRLLAAGYDAGVPVSPGEELPAEAFARWRETVQPFHWLAEWYDVLSRGGFDVIIGNPPYVAYSQVKGAYRVQDYETLSCGNLCAYVLERAMALLCSAGRCGMITPVSTIANESYRPLGRLLFAKQGWISSYSNRPGKLFAGVEQRLAILLLRNVEAGTVLSSAYRHWYEPERAHLFATLSYTPASIWEPTGMPVKSGNRLAEAIFARLTRQQDFPLLDSQRPGALVWVHNGPTYWVRALPFEPNAGRKSPRSEHYCKLPVETQEAACMLTAILNSSTFYFFYKLVSNCRDLGQKELHCFPLGQLQPAHAAQLARLGASLSQLLRASTASRTRHYTRAAQIYEWSYEEYYPARAGELLAQIDRVLAEHYGFSEEELDFLLHYDHKYRLGKEVIRGKR